VKAARFSWPPGVRAASILALSALLPACATSAAVQQGPSDTLRTYAQALEQGRVDEAYRLLSDEAKRSMSLEAFRKAVQENPEDALEIAQAIARPATDPVVTATVTVPNGDELLLVYEGGRWRIDAAAVDLYSQSTPRQALLGFLRAFERRRYDVILRYVPDAEKEGLVGGGLAGDEPSAAAPAPDAAATQAGTAAQAGAGPAAQVGAAPAAQAGAGKAGGGKDAGKTDGKVAGDAPVPPAAPAGSELTAEKLKAAWEGPQKKQINDIVQAIKAALPTAQIEETGDSAAMPYGAVGTVAFVREHGLWKLKDF
jgi:hypothetical protein